MCFPSTVPQNHEGSNHSFCVGKSYAVVLKVQIVLVLKVYIVLGPHTFPRKSKNGLHTPFLNAKKRGRATGSMRLQSNWAKFPTALIHRNFRNRNSRKRPSPAGTCKEELS